MSRQYGRFSRWPPPSYSSSTFCLRNTRSPCAIRAPYSLWMRPLTSGSGNPSRTMSSRSTVSRGESVRGRISRSADRNSVSPRTPRKESTCSLSLSMAAVGLCRFSRPSPMTTRSSRGRMLAHCTPASIGDATRSPSTVAGVTVLLCPVMPRDLGAWCAERAATWRDSSAKFSGILRRWILAAVVCENISCWGIRAA